MFQTSMELPGRIQGLRSEVWKNRKIWNQKFASEKSKKWKKKIWKIALQYVTKSLEALFMTFCGLMCDLISKKKSGASEHGAAIIQSLPVRILTTPTSNQSPFPRGPFVFRRNLVRMRFPDCQVEQFRLPDCQVEQFGPPNWPFQTWAASKIRPDRRGRDWTKPSGINNQCTSNAPASWDHIKNNSFEKEATGTTSRITGPPRNNHNQNNETYNPIHTLFYSSLRYFASALSSLLLSSLVLRSSILYFSLLSSTPCESMTHPLQCAEKPFGMQNALRVVRSNVIFVTHATSAANFGVSLKGCKTQRNCNIPAWSS